MNDSTVLKSDEFRTSDVPPGSAVAVGGAAVFNINRKFCATQAQCTHRGGPLAEGRLEGSTVTCTWHGSQFDVTTGAVVTGPAQEPLKTYPVTVEGDLGRIEGIP